MYVQYSLIASQSDNCLTVPVQAVKYVSFANIPGYAPEGGDGMAEGDAPMDGEVSTDGGIGRGRSGAVLTGNGSLFRNGGIFFIRRNSSVGLHRIVRRSRGGLLDHRLFLIINLLTRQRSG